MMRLRTIIGTRLCRRRPGRDGYYRGGDTTRHRHTQLPHHTLHTHIAQIDGKTRRLLLVSDPQ
ncbi:hypothetical protein [Sphingomonas carotinifaciens]|uniref:Uncharacterized protein n=2 Tax=Sphingomonas carotinifaciens TaxID=1166323 RepID=A0A6N8LWQ6_9SPHN|nr:hypothetical protein [Sphingomonas carotinifaciens]MBB4087668.1 hypothetical protein [Sphingomonas carotinifaciens]MWC44967.1 hypothetical protein [Sphingomonas carotinifaciens]